MNDLDFSSYQTAETAWRWQTRIGILRARRAELVRELDEVNEKIDELLEMPPLYSLFNWSA